ncbi:hypothetical protein STRDD10_00859 [Streptococcus sp. DD10]|uniref:alpha/beta fold hydrolase n=1 Tax=Streptococcus sp. DD10 TaxID=1777878 RepID=UPI000796922D|nr:alpha/beta hydrolase [Streptococcus sp. DD10]KXT74571.1 hypothetical protein STRDD10_00859 [Streptococcus sp. DD10]
MKSYFIGGLGCNPVYPQAFFQELSFPVHYLDLYRASIETLEELDNWFAQQIQSEENVVLLAHSLGGDLAVYLSNHFPAIKKLILLDGGYLDMERICSLEEELEGAAAYLNSYRFSSVEEAVEQEKSQSAIWSDYLEQAVRAGLVWNPAEAVWQSFLTLDRVSRLLSLRRQVQGQIQQLQQDCLFLIPQLTELTPNWVRESLTQVPTSVEVVQLANASHDLYVEQPQRLADLVEKFLKS